MTWKIAAYAHDVLDLRIEDCGHGKWAVRSGGQCFNKQGEWEYEPLPSSRDDEFLERCRFNSFIEAKDFTEQNL